MPNLSHLWQRFLMASSLLFGLIVGVAATVFGYSNLSTVDVHWSVVHLDGIPLWTVAVVPLAVVLVAGTLYHWANSFHHFTEHMRHRHRVHELESEVERLKSHLDRLLEMPSHSSAEPSEPAVSLEAAPLPAAIAALPEPDSASANGGPKLPRRALARRKDNVENATKSESAVAAAVEEPAGKETEEVVLEPDKAADPVEA